MKTIQRLLLVFSLIFMCSPIFAAKIVKVKGRRVTIKLDGMKVKKGTRLNVYYKKKWKAQVAVTKVKGKYAFGVRKGKGRIKKGYTLKVSKVNAKEPKSLKKKKSNDDYIAGFLVGPLIFSMNVTDTTTNTTKELTSTGLLLVKGFLDYNVFDFFEARLGVGFANFEATNDTCAGICEVAINYFIIDATPRFIFNKKSNIRPWIGGNLGLYVPTGFVVTAIGDDSVAATGFFGVSGGVDIQFGEMKELMIPIQFTYGIFPPSDTVTANAMTLSAGFAFKF